MVSTCANPECSVPFRHLKQGRLIVIDPRDQGHSHVPAPSSRLEYFWLCDLCAPRFCLAVEPGNRVRCVSRAKNDATDRLEPRSA